MNVMSIDQVLKDSNLYHAWLKVQSNQGAAGIDGITIQQFAHDLNRNLSLITNEVLHSTYRPKTLLRVDIPKQYGGVRSLSIPCVRDRVLQTAVTRVLTPVFELQFEDISFAYRNGRSVDQAVRLISRLRDEGYQWVVNADIKAFFDEVDHECLMLEIRKLVSDTAILSLIELWLKAKVSHNEVQYTLSKGIPQGSPLSPLLANLYLDQLDDQLLSKGHRIVRYADDFIILCKTRKRAEKTLKLTGEVLKSIKLAFNREKTHITHFDRGFRYLGVDFIRSLTLKAPKDKVERLWKPSRQEQALLPEKIELPESDDSALLNAMQQAFAEADIVADQFTPELSEAEGSDLETAIEDDQTSYSYDPALQTLFLTQHGSVLGKQQERFSVQRDGEEAKIIPAVHVDQIIVLGNVQITTQVMRFCLERRTPIYLLNGRGRYYGAIDSFQTEPVKLHKQQFLLSDDENFCLELAREIIRCKISNSLLILRRHARYRRVFALNQAITELKQMLSSLVSAQTLDQVRGYEGFAARQYFQAMGVLIDSEWKFGKRVKRPATDPINALLSFGYTLLFYNVLSLLRLQGLNPHVGFLHPIRMGHPALVSDMVEEFRAVIVDAVVLNLVVNQRISLKDFTIASDDSACQINRATRRRFIEALEKKMNSAITHPNSGLKLDYRRLIAHQAKHLASVIRGKTSAYKGVVLK